MPQRLKLIPVKMKGLITKFQTLRRRRDSIIEPLVLINIIVVVATVKVIVVVFTGEFCGIVVAPVVSGLILGASTSEDYFIILK